MILHSWARCWIFSCISLDHIDWLLVVTSTESEQNLLIVSFSVILKERKVQRTVCKLNFNTNFTQFTLASFCEMNNSDIFIVSISGQMFAHQNVLVECFAVAFLVLILDAFHVDFRATHHDAGQGFFAGTFTLMGRKKSVTEGLQAAFCE